MVWESHIICLWCLLPLRAGSKDDKKGCLSISLIQCPVVCPRSSHPRDLYLQAAATAGARQRTPPELGLSVWLTVCLPGAYLEQRLAHGRRVIKVHFR